MNLQKALLALSQANAMKENASIREAELHTEKEYYATVLFSGLKK